MDFLSELLWWVILWSVLFPWPKIIETIVILKYKKRPQNYRLNAKFPRLVGGLVPQTPPAGRGPCTPPGAWAALGPLPTFGPPYPPTLPDLVRPCFSLPRLLGGKANSSWDCLCTLLSLSLPQPAVTCPSPWSKVGGFIYAVACFDMQLNHYKYNNANRGQIQGRTVQEIAAVWVSLLYASKHFFSSFLIRNYFLLFCIWLLARWEISGGVRFRFHFQSKRALWPSYFIVCERISVSQKKNAMK